MPKLLSDSLTGDIRTRFSRADSDICCYPLLKYSGISNIPSVFALPDEKSVPRELFDLRRAYFRKICGFSEEGGLRPPMTKSHKDFEIHLPEAGSDTSCQARLRVSPRPRRAQSRTAFPPWIREWFPQGLFRCPSRCACRAAPGGSRPSCGARPPRRTY